MSSPDPRRHHAVVARAESVAATITFLLSDDSANTTGAIVTSDGGWSAL